MYSMAMALEGKIISWRRYLHSIPELGFNLPRTREYIRDELGTMGIKTRELAGGLVADIGEGAPIVALRADMDGLPIGEETGLGFASQNGCMHACGHDGHMAMLLGAAQMLLNSGPKHGVRLIFQPAEEECIGAAAMIEGGVLDGVEKLYGCHLGSLWNIPCGHIGVRAGALLSSNSPFKAVFHGKSAHGATPHKGVDTIAIASSAVSAMQQIISRRTSPNEPAVVTIGRFSGGNAYNIIAETTTIEGTIRSFSDEQQVSLCQAVQDVCTHSAIMMGGTCCVEFPHTLPVLKNDPKLTEQFTEIAKRAGGRVEILPSPAMVSEDFAIMAGLVPAVFFFINSSKPSMQWPHHHPKFDIDESVLAIGSSVLASCAS